MIVCKFELPAGGVCNFENADDAEWCGNCGEKLEWYGERVIAAVPEPVVVVEDQDERPAGLVQRVKSALNIGGEEDTSGKVATDVADAPVVIPEASPSTRADTGAPSDVGGPSRSDQQTVPSSVALPDERTRDQPKATLPTDERGAPKPVVKRLKPPKAKPGDLICGACGTPNDPSRNFCSRCGTSLKEAQVVKVPWWRRIFHRRDRSVPIDDTASAAATRPEAARAPQPRVKNFLAKLVIFALFGAVIAGFAVPSLRSMAIGWYESVRDVLFPAYDEVEPMSASASSHIGRCDDAGKGIDLEKDHCAFDAFDAVTDTFWAEGAPDTGLHQMLTADFQQAFDLAKIRIVVGSKDEFNTFARPNELRVTVRNKANKQIKFVADGRKVWSMRWELEDTPATQEVSLTAHNVSHVTFEILRVRRGSQSDQRTSIQNIWFLEPG